MGWVLVLLFFVSCGVSRIGAPAQVPGPRVILKLDDLYYEQGFIHPGWEKAFALLNEREIVATIGIVGEKLEGASPEVFDWLKQQHALGHEIWNHGWCHCKPVVEGVELSEFQGIPQREQYEALQKTQLLAREKLGLELLTFGAPYNAVDLATSLAIEEIPEIRYWFYPPPKMETDKVTFPRVKPLNIEYPVHVPRLDSLRANWDTYREAEDVIVLQGHPRSWTAEPERMEEFRRIIDFLQTLNVQFVTPQSLARQKETMGK